MNRNGVLSPLKNNQILFLKTALSLSISHCQLVEDLKNDRSKYVMIDVRDSPPYIKKNQIPGALAIPTQTLPAQLNQLDNKKTYVLYDWAFGTRSVKEALLILLSADLDAYELDCGFEGWMDMSLPIEKAIK